MAKYFTIMVGLRGCYMPDSAYVTRCDTRRELKATIEWEANSIRDAGFVGITKRDIAAFAAHMWREAHKAKPSFYPDVLAYGHKRDNLHSAIHCSVATRCEYEESQQND